MTSALKSVFLKGGEAPRSPRIFKKRIGKVDPGIAHGEAVAIRDPGGRFVGRGFYSPRSVIAARVLDRDEHGPPIDGAWFARRIRAAQRLRTDVLRLPDVTDAWRVVHAEGDGLSGLVIDKFADAYVVEVGCRGMFERLHEIEGALDGEVVVRADATGARVEGFSAQDRRAKPVHRTIHEHGLKYRVDCRGGHKTGFFVDQRESRRRVAELARGRRVLDLCSYTGGFALNAIRGGAKSVVAVDLDEEVVAAARENARLNGMKLQAEHADVFDFLRSRPKSDFIVLDPPKLARTPKELGRGRSKSVDFNKLAIGALAPGGLLYTFSCTGLFSESDFVGQVREAARKAGRSARILEVTGQPGDHPVHVDCPESRYLGCVLLQVD